MEGGQFSGDVDTTGADPTILAKRQPACSCHDGPIRRTIFAHPGELARSALLTSSFGSAACRLWGLFVGTYSTRAYAAYAGWREASGPHAALTRLEAAKREALRRHALCMPTHLPYYSTASCCARASGASICAARSVERPLRTTGQLGGADRESLGPIPVDGRSVTPRLTWPELPYRGGARRESSPDGSCGTLLVGRPI